MVELEPEKKQSKKLEVFLAVCLVAVVLIAVVYLYFYYNTKAQNIDNEPVFTTTFKGLGPEEVYDLINKSDNLLIIDTSSCQCKWKGSCINLSSVWNVNPASFINETRDILVCDYSGTDSVSFCEGLVNNTYGKIYYLIGGTTAWKAKGFPTYNCS